MGTHIGRDEIHGSSYEMSGDFRQSILNITTNYFDASGRPQLMDENQFQAALVSYLKWVEKRYSRLTLRGLERREAGQLTLNLDEIYISLVATVDLEEDEGKRRRSLRPPRAYEGESELAGLQPIDMAQLLTLDDRLVITGGPGSGKSTYLYLIASSIARALVTGDTESVERALGLRGLLPLPIVVSLGGYNSYRRERRGTLIDYISHAIIEQNAAIGLPDDFFKRLLMHGRSCLLLLDGLDEVAAEDDRAIVRQKVEELAHNDGIGRLIVTSRTRAYQGEAVLPFRLAAVRSMTQKQVRALASKWCDAAYEPDEAIRQADHLRREIEQLEALRAARHQPRLVDTPLLVTIIAIVHDNLRRLPEQRAALYEECVKALLSEHHKAPSDEKRALVEWGGTFNEKRNVLAQLAYEMMSNADQAKPTVGEGQLKEWVRPLVVRMRGEGVADAWLQRFTEAMRERGSLLDERDGVYQFTHLTFQEFLAATYLGDTIGEVGDIVGHLTMEGRVVDSWWRETTLLTAAYVGLRSPDRALRLLNRLASVPVPDKGDIEIALSVAELAGSSFLELGSHDTTTRRAIAERLVALLTDANLTATNQLRGLAGLALGRLGDPRDDVNCSVPKTVLIPAGEFIMGSERRRGQPSYDDMAPWNDESTPEGAPLRLKLPAYRIGKYPVTVAQYRRFVEAGGYDLQQWGKLWQGDGLKWLRQRGQRTPFLWNDPQWTVDNHPVVGVTWYEAVAYCAWLSATEGRQFRLPDEAMWEKAARGTDGRRWPWGNEWNATKLNADQMIGRTSAVGIFPAGQSPYSVYDCSGNVWEWCSGPGYSDYPLTLRSYEEDLALAAKTRANRGGSWGLDNKGTRVAYRYYYDPDYRDYYFGFRVAELLSDPES